MATSTPTLPTLPPLHDPAALAVRQLATAIARTSYNYMVTYVEPIPMSADVPKEEAFTLDYYHKTLPVFLAIIDNFTKVTVGLVEKELEGDLGALALPSVKAVELALKDLESDHGIFGNPLGDVKDMITIVKALAEVPREIEVALKGVKQVAKDLDTVVTGLAKAFNEMVAVGPTAFLQYTLYDVMNPSGRRDYLEPKSYQDFINLYQTLPLPLCLDLPQEPWMDGKTPWQSDWYFGYLQIAGYNTTNLKRVTPAGTGSGLALDALLRKMPITDAIFQRELGDRSLTLESAARDGHLYVVDLLMLDGISGGKAFDKTRYPTAPIALFYWNQTPPRGYPAKGKGVMQPVAIQLGQRHDAETMPIFTPRDGDRWTVAKTLVQSASSIQHETVAHLGACHLTIEPMVVATNRQLPACHPIFVLLKPHFRFTIAINDAALTSLIVPEGVVATNVGVSIQDDMALIVAAHEAWRFDEQEPNRLFQSRGVDGDHLPEFPFRDDTLLVWRALSSFVDSYVQLYYASDADVGADVELQAWIGEMTSPLYAHVRGMDGLVKGGTADKPTLAIQSRKYLAQVITQIIYIAGPGHAAVNYAQYPLLSLVCSVPGGTYEPPPGRGEGPLDLMKWLPPLDIALYQVSFVYLLSMIQYDTLGVYSLDPRVPYFVDDRVNDLVANLQGELAMAEIEIRKRNRSRPIPYMCQLPSMIPNSISI